MTDFNQWEEVIGKISKEGLEKIQSVPSLSSIKELIISILEHIKDHEERIKKLENDKGKLSH